MDLLRYAELADYDEALRSGRRLGGEAGERFAACWRSLYNRPKRYLTRQLLQETTQAVLQQGRPLSEVLRRGRGRLRGGQLGPEGQWYVTVDFQGRGPVKLLASIAPLQRLRETRE